MLIPSAGETVRSMNVRQKRRQLNRGLYIVLALLVVVTMCVTIIAFAASRRNRTNPSETTDPNQTTAAPSSTTRAPSQTTAPEQTTAPAETTAPDPGSTTHSGGSPGSVPTVTDPEWCAPVSGSLLKGFSGDIPVFSNTLEDYRIHTGIDITGKLGDPVYAAADGIITSISYDPMMGQTIIIDHGNGIQSVYKGVSTELPVTTLTGAQVSAGDIIAAVGESALIEYSDDTHVHFEMMDNGEYIDPAEFVGSLLLAPEADYED